MIHILWLVFCGHFHVFPFRESRGIYAGVPVALWSCWNWSIVGLRAVVLSNILMCVYCKGTVRIWILNFVNGETYSALINNLPKAKPAAEIARVMRCVRGARSHCVDTPDPGHVSLPPHPLPLPNLPPLHPVHPSPLPPLPTLPPFLSRRRKRTRKILLCCLFLESSNGPPKSDFDWRERRLFYFLKKKKSLTDCYQT